MNRGVYSPITDTFNHLGNIPCVEAQSQGHYSCEACSSPVKQTSINKGVHKVTPGITEHD